MKTNTPIKMCLPLALGLVPALGWTPSALAGPCLPAGERDDFEADLIAAFEASTLDVDQLYDHATNRLGYGWAGAPGTRSHALLADLVADSLAVASSATAADALDVQLAGLVAGNGSIPYAFVDDTMAAVYVEFQGNQGSRGAIRNLAGARSIAQALTGPNIDIGTVLQEHWYNHFNVYATKTDWATVSYQEQIRSQQCGTFGAMLTATAKHPAMLIYLDNRYSVVGDINENYGRELLELMTFGDDQYVWYDQDDVVAAANAFTGWTISLAGNNPQFSFVAANHDAQQLVLFSGAQQLTLAPAASVTRGEQLLTHLAAHPATKQNVCSKLVRRILGRVPAATVTACKDAWGTGGELGHMVQAILVHPETWSSASYRKQVKNPLELVVSAHRALGTNQATLGTIAGVRNLSSSMGLPVTMVPPPTGYPDTLSGWAGAGNSITWTEHGFASLATNGISFSLNGAPASSGGTLETAMATFMATSPNAAALNVVIDDVKSKLGLPPALGVPYAALRLALQNPDVYTPNGTPRSFRTVVHGILTTPSFLRK
jgi:uncharacterized protein (DUF1800 family)